MVAVLMSIGIGVGVLILTVIIINLIKFLQWHGNMVRTLSHFPGPKTHWLFGNALQVFRLKKYINYIQSFIPI